MKKKNRCPFLLELMRPFVPRRGKKKSRGSGERKKEGKERKENEDKRERGKWKKACLAFFQTMREKRSTQEETGSFNGRDTNVVRLGYWQKEPRPYFHPSARFPSSSNANVSQVSLIATTAKPPFPSHIRDPGVWILNRLFAARWILISTIRVSHKHPEMIGRASSSKKLPLANLFLFPPRLFPQPLASRLARATSNPDVEFHPSSPYPCNARMSFNNRRKSFRHAPSCNPSCATSVLRVKFNGICLWYLAVNDLGIGALVAQIAAVAVVDEFSLYLWSLVQWITIVLAR